MCVIFIFVLCFYCLSSGEKSQIDEDLVRMVIEDTQPFSIVEDKGFKRFVKSLNPTYVLPTKKVIKALNMVLLLNKTVNNMDRQD